jgi:hypothetical protein
VQALLQLLQTVYLSAQMVAVAGVAGLDQHRLDYGSSSSISSQWERSTSAVNYKDDVHVTPSSVVAIIREAFFER